MTSDEKAKLREMFVRYQYCYKLGVEAEYSEEERIFFLGVKNKYEAEYQKLWEEVADEMDGLRWGQRNEREYT